MPETKPAETRPVSRVTAPCCDGSASAALWHRINGTDPCDASRDAQNAYHQEQWKNPAPRRKAGRAPGELYGDELGAAVLAHLIAHPVGLTSREIARAFGYRNPDGGASLRVLLQLWKLFHVGKVGYVVTPRLDGSARTTRRWSANTSGEAGRA